VPFLPEEPLREVSPLSLLTAQADEEEEDVFNAMQFASFELLQQAMTPSYQKLLKLIGGEPGGLRVLLAMRADALKSCSEIRNRNLATLAAELRTHLEVILASHAHQPHPAPPEMETVQRTASWSRTMATESRPAFELVDWREAKVGFLEKLMEYERVHSVAGFEDLQCRLESRLMCPYMVIITN